MRFSRMGESLLQCGFAFIVALLLVCGASAQSTTDGAIAGTVLDASGAVVTNAKVTVRNLGTNLSDTLTTDENGYFRVGKLQPATYSVVIEAAGFGNFTAEQVIVQVGTVTEIHANLKVASAGATILVSAEIPQVNTTSPEFAPTLDQNAISNLPINGGRWSSFVLLTPGAVSNASGFGLISFRGISTLLNNNTIDGGDNNQAFFSEERGRTRIGYSSAKAAVQEFQVNTSNYSAEYGRAAGAVVNTVTKSGTNSYHGELYFYDRDNSWGATNPFTTLTTPNSSGGYTTSPYNPVDVRKMYGFGIGGPIVKDKLFFFFAFDRYDRNFPGTAKANSPSAFFAPQTTTSSAITTLASRLGVTTAQALTDYNNGLTALLGELGAVPRKGLSTIFFPKLDWQINSRNHATFEVNRTRWTSPAGIQTQASNNFGTNSFGNDYVRDTWGVAKLYTSITNTLTNEARFQYGRDFEYEFAQPPSAYEKTNLLAPAGYTNPLGLPPDVCIQCGRGNGFEFGVPTFLQRPAFPDERRSQYADTLSWTHGKHTLKFGADVAHTSDLSQNLRTQYGSFNYSSVTDYFSDLYGVKTCQDAKNNAIPCYSSFSQSFGPLGFSFNTNDLAFFAEDNWRVLPRLTLNLGLRYEYEMLPSVILPNSAVPQTQSFPSDKNNLAPRLGFAWDILGDGKTALRGGYGIFYGRLINSTIYNALTSTGVSGGQFSYSFKPTVASAQPCSPAFPQILPPTSLPTCPVGLNVTFFDPSFQLPLVHETDLTLEREIAPNTVVSISYMGSFGRDLPDFVDTNLAPSTSNITYSVLKGGPLTASTYTTPLYTSRINPAYGAMTKIFSGVNSNYNAMAAQISRRMTNHLQALASYTWSHSLDNGQNESTFSDTNDLLVPTNIGREYGNSIYNVPNRFVVSAIAESPWHVGGPLQYLTNDWELSPIYSSQSGLPYSLTTSGSAVGGASSGINGSGGRPGIDLIGRNTFQMKRTINMDMRLAKKIRFTESKSVEILGEAFNIFNHQNVTGVNTQGYNLGGTASAPTLTYNAPFGSVTGSNSNFAYTSRQIQIGFRFFF